MDFVWPFIKHPSYFYKTGLFNELEYSIKSVRKFYKGKARCFVVGDDPGLDVIHIPCEYVLKTTGYYRHFDIINKLKTALIHVGQEFVQMYDDIYLLKPTTKKQIQQIYARAEITDIEEYGRFKRMGDPSYKTAWKQTYRIIKEFREDIYDWETHLPRYFVSSGLKYVIDTWDLTNNDHFHGSLYAAYYSDKPKWLDGIQSDLWTYGPNMDLEAEFDKQFLNIYDDALAAPVIRKIKEVIDA